MTNHQYGGSALIIFVLLVLILAFEIWMLVDVIRNRNISGNARALWIVGMLLVHPVVAIVYYFTDHKKSV